MFYPSSNLINLYAELEKQLDEYKDINNEYVQIKLQEEKMKTKKFKQT